MKYSASNIEKNVGLNERKIVAHTILLYIERRRPDA